MAKAVRWQIPFVSSIEQTQYRIDIYDEQDGTWSGVTTLTGGPSPIVTDEDASDDFFAPIRTQTGNIEVCTAIPGGGTLSLEDILPENNIARPVRLVSIAADMSEKIEWQGFLSCEAYSQSYTDIPEIIQLPINSVLEAMDSVEVEMADKMMFNRIIAHLLYAMQTITDKSGMDLFTSVVTPAYCQDALITKYFYNNVYFTADQVVSGDNIVVEVHSISCKQILSQIAQFFGCCWREVGTDLYLEAIGENFNYTAFEFSTFANKYLNNTGVTISSPRALLTENLADCEWMGTDHQKSVLQGKRRVKVSTSLKDFECNIELQECPIGSLIENPEDRQASKGEIHANTNSTFFSLAKHQCLVTTANFASDGTSGATLTLNSISSAPSIQLTLPWVDNEFRTYYEELVDPPRSKAGSIRYYATSYMCFWRDQQGELISGLMVCGIPKYLFWSINPPQGYKWTKFAHTKDNYTFKQSSPMVFSTGGGFLSLDVTLAPILWDGQGYKAERLVGETYQPGWYQAYQPSITMAIQIGNKWVTRVDAGGLTVYGITNEFTTFALDLNYDGTTKKNYDTITGVAKAEGIMIPILQQVTGVVTVYVYPEMDAIVNGYMANSPFDFIIRQLKLEFIPVEGELLSDRSENAYTIETGKAFKDEAEISLALSSDAKNNKLATMIYDSSAKPVSLIYLGGSASTRPEIDLLHRMKDYYTDPKVILDVESQRLASPLPILNLNGINDGKVYTPLAESRDWRAEKSTLTCFEIPN